MAVKSIFYIYVYRCKILGRTISFILKYIEIRKHFLKYHSPRVSAQALACICVTIFYILYGSDLLAQGGGGGVCSAAQKPGPKNKMPFLPNKK